MLTLEGHRHLVRSARPPAPPPPFYQTQQQQREHYLREQGG